MFDALRINWAYGLPGLPANGVGRGRTCTVGSEPRRGLNGSDGRVYVVGDVPGEGVSFSGEQSDESESLPKLYLYFKSEFSAWILRLLSHGQPRPQGIPDM